MDKMLIELVDSVQPDLGVFSSNGSMALARAILSKEYKTVREMLCLATEDNINALLQDLLVRDPNIIFKPVVHTLESDALSAFEAYKQLEDCILGLKGGDVTCQIL